jgi:glyceraldehyde 3-phosphate dehydrogenase
VAHRLSLVCHDSFLRWAIYLASVHFFDSVQGRWRSRIQPEGDDALRIDGRRLGFTAHPSAAPIPWGDLGVDLVLECTGKFLTPETLQGHLDRGAKRVIVAAPVKQGDVLNVVVGVNEPLYEPARHSSVTAASCTTNGLVPVVRVVHEALGIRHGHRPDLPRAEGPAQRCTPCARRCSTRR